MAPCLNRPGDRYPRLWQSEVFAEAKSFYSRGYAMLCICQRRLARILSTLSGLRDASRQLSLECGNFAVPSAVRFRIKPFSMAPIACASD